MGTDVEAIGNKTKSRVAGLVLASIVLGVLVVANLPFQYVETETRWLGMLELDLLGSPRRYQQPPVMAGWPLNYWVRYEVDGEVQNRFWSGGRLGVNLGIAMILSVCVYGYIQVRNRHTQPTAGGQRARVAFDAGIALAILLTPGTFLACQHATARQHRQLAQRLVRQGNVQMSCWLPAPIVNHVPRGIVPSLLRIRHAHLMRPDTAMVRAVAGIPTLAGLECYRGDFETNAMEPLHRNLHFCGLRLYSRQLSDADIDLIADLPWVCMLGLSRSNLDAAMLRRFDHMRLKSVDLTRTPLELSKLGQPGWAATAEELYLTRPQRGSEASLTIEGWKQLKRLSVTRLTSQMNESEFKVCLKSLPRLEKLNLDRLQKHDCVFHNLPRLAEIDEGVATLRFVLRFEEMIPGLMWLSNLDIDGVASLTGITCFVRDLKSVTIGRTPNLREVKFGSFLSSSLGDVLLQPADAALCQEWVNQLGRRNGPGTVDFTGLPLTNVDLSPLTGNRRIRDLRLGDSGVTFDQVKSLAGMEQLESLDIGTCRLERDQLSWVLDEFPRLERLRIHGKELRNFDLTGMNRLREIQMTRLEQVNEVRIVDLPSLKAYLRISTSPQHLEICNAASLRGLAIESPWPESWKLAGLRDLEWFAGGGPQINDELLDVVLRCRAIDQLTLAYPSLSQAKLREIGRLTELTMLAVPGADVDDSVTADWKDLQTLWEISLDDTAVSVRTLAWLSRLESLRRISLNRVPLDDVTAEALAELRAVSEIHLAGVDVEPEKLGRLLQVGTLESLNLSGCEVNGQLIDVLSRAASLKYLILRDTSIDTESLNRLLAANPRLYVDLGDDAGLLSDEVAADLRRRGQRVQRDFSTGWRQALKLGSVIDPEHHQARRRLLDQSDKSGRINAQAFRPKLNSDSGLK